MAGTSDARIAANRKNASKSTGPKTPEGKAKARANAVKHGLTGAGIALPTEAAALVEQRFLTLQEEMGPTDLASRLLVRQMALCSVRIERAAQQETAALTTRLRHAASDFDLNRLQEIDRLFETIETCPGDHRRRLLAQPEGVDKLIEALASARDQLLTKAYKRWGWDHHKKIEALFGGTFGDFPITRTDALMAALSDNFENLKPSELAQYRGKKEKQEFARVELIRVIELELAKLAKVRAGLDLEVLAQDRAEAADRALFDPDPAAMSARKYEAAATRGFFRALRDFHQNEANGSEASAEVSNHLDGKIDRMIEAQPVASPEVTISRPKAQGEAVQARPDPVSGGQRATDSSANRENEPNSATPAEVPSLANSRQNEPNSPRRVIDPQPDPASSSRILNYRY